MTLEEFLSQPRTLAEIAEFNKRKPDTCKRCDKIVAYGGCGDVITYCKKCRKELKSEGYAPEKPTPLYDGFS